MINLPINLTSNSYIVDSIYMRMKSHMLHMKICSEQFMLSEDFRNSRINTTTCIFLQPHLINNKNVHNFLYQQEKSFFSEVFIYCCLWKFGHTTCNKHDICVSLCMYMCFCVGCICVCDNKNYIYNAINYSLGRKRNHSLFQNSVIYFATSSFF